MPVTSAPVVTTEAVHTTETVVTTQMVVTSEVVITSDVVVTSTEAVTTTETAVTTDPPQDVTDEPKTEEMADVPSFDHDLSNVVLYLDDGDDIMKIKIEDFPSNADGIKDANTLPLEQFVAENYPDAELVGITIKAGTNAVDGYGPGEGELFILKDGVTEADLPMADKADDTYSFNDAFDGMEMGESEVGATVEQNLGVTIGSSQGLDAAQDSFTFGDAQSTGGGGETQDGWTQLVLDGDAALSAEGGWNKPVKENVEVKDSASDTGESREEKHVDNNPDSIGW
ncbi:hypothetical protein MTBLM5_360023 [Magnetospirillum sp. LM-5]|nr:hypothetical protein MTBLM5_360023 [Magnetospirillum sp. LM-5]